MILKSWLSKSSQVGDPQSDLQSEEGWNYLP